MQNKLVSCLACIRRYSVGANCRRKMPCRKPLNLGLHYTIENGPNGVKTFTDPIGGTVRPSSPDSGLQNAWRSSNCAIANFRRTIYLQGGFFIRSRFFSKGFAVRGSMSYFAEGGPGEVPWRRRKACASEAICNGPSNSWPAHRAQRRVSTPFFLRILSPRLASKQGLAACKTTTQVVVQHNRTGLPPFSIVFHV